MKFEYYQSKRGQQLWWWRLVAKNGRIIADSGEGYASAGNCRRAISRVKSLIGGALLNFDVPVEQVAK